jgi:hypothetical protein
VLDDLGTDWPWIRPEADPRAPHDSTVGESAEVSVILLPDCYPRADGGTTATVWTPPFLPTVR